MTWDVISLALAFATGLALGALPWLLLSGRAPQDATDRRARRRETVRIAAASVGLTVLVLASGGYLAMRLLLDFSAAQPVTVDRALERFRSNAPATPPPASASPDAGFGRPEPGVYTYRAEGYFDITAPVFGHERQELPPTVPVTVQADAEGWTWRVDYSNRRQGTCRFVPAPGPRLDEPTLDTEYESFGIRVRAQLTCEPARVLVPEQRPGEEWAQDCISRTDFGLGTNHSMPSRTSYVGLETVRVGDRDLPAHHLHRETEVTGGQQTGYVRRDVWYSAADGLPLRWVSSSRTEGMAVNLEELRLELTALEPQR